MTDLNAGSRLLRSMLLSSLILSFGNIASSAQEVISKAAVTKIEGPYSYRDKNDSVPILGWIKERLSNDEANLLLCDGNVIKVNIVSLEPVHRNCPQGSPVGPWMLGADGKIVALVAHAKDPKVFGGLDKKEITFRDFEPAFQTYINEAKEGDWVALSYPSERGISLGVIDRSRVQ
jgi:hypothetical protein